MTSKKPNRSKKVTGLPRQAEELLRAAKRDIAARPGMDVQQLLHELQVHQIDLETQNEELRRTQMELQAARNRYLELYDFAPAAHLTLDTHGTIVEGNLTAVTLLSINRKELIGQPFARFLASKDQDIYHRHCQEVLRTGRRQTCEVRLREIAGVSRCIYCESLAVHDESGHITHMRTAFLDITDRKQAEEARNLLADIVESSGDGIISTDLAGIIGSWNQGAERLYGYTSEEMIGQSITRVIPAERLDEKTQDFDRVQRGEQVASFETIRKRKDGSSLPVSIVVSSVKNQSGTIIGAAEIVRDITAQKRLEENFRRILEGAPNGMILINQKGTITLVNASAERMFGYTREELLGQSIDTLVPAQFQGAHPGHRVAFFADPKARPIGAGRDLYGVHKDGREIPVEIALNPIETNDGLMVLSSITDISERKRADEEIRRRGQLLEATNKELEAFSYSVSHDLRAPLRSIDGFSQALLEDCAGLLSERGTDHLNRIRAASQRMGQLIDDLLSLTRTTRHELLCRPVDLSALALDSANEVRKIWPGRQVELVVAPGLRAQGDRQLLRIVFDNLLGNAWKFTSKQVRAAIEVGALSHDGTTAYFVRDNGAGFDMAYVDKLFAPFQRLHAMTEYPGTGIGLATVRRIIARHGGLVWAEGHVGQGATFYFTLGERNAE